MKTTSALLAGIISASPSPLVLQAPEMIATGRGKGKGRGKSETAKCWIRGSWHTQRKGPFNTHKEDSRRLNQISRGIIKVSS